MNAGVVAEDHRVMPPLIAPRPIVGLTQGLIAEAEAKRELTAMQRQYQLRTGRMRSARTAHYAAR
jgi:hypothetical protein